MKISHELVTLRTKHEFTIARGGSSEFRVVLVTVTDRDGAFGVGEADPSRFYGEYADTVPVALAQFAPILERADGWSLEGIEADMNAKMKGNGAAKSAVMAALYDLMGKRLGQPLYKLFGLDPAKAPGSSFTIGFAPEEEMRLKLREAKDYPILKVKLGTDHDEDVIRIIREEAPDKTLYVDANCAWTPKQALNSIEMLVGYDVEIVEQPLPPTDPEGLRFVRDRSPLPIIADESCLVASDIPKLAGVVDGINIKLAKCGGPREAIKMAATARAHGMLVMMGCMIETSVGITTAAHLAPLLDYADLDGAALVANDPYKGATIDRGVITIPHRTGARRHESMSGKRYLEVALPLPLFQTFTYSVPDSAPLPAPGMRVLVPVRGRRAIGIVLGPATGEGVKNPKDILDAPDAEASVPAELLALARWIAEYFVAPVGLVLRAMLPSALTGSRVPRPAPRTQRIARISVELPSLEERDRVFARAARQRALYEALESLGGASDTAHLNTQLGFAPAVIRALAERGLIALSESEVVRDPFLARAIPPASVHVPTAAQRDALTALVAAKPGAAFLLRGITGSGKTLVYIEFLREIVERRGKSAIVLVPEIALTPQAVDRFRAAFGERIAVLHSGLSDGERYDAWRALRNGTKTIAVGARSAIFAPLANLGAIIVDEEHEGSYKNGETPRYHAREVALVRARDEGAVVVLGSATPSLESWQNAQAGKYTLLTLPERVADAKLPAVEVVDMRAPARPGAQGPRAAVIDPFRRVFSEPLEAALGERLQRGEQSILLLNRRGFAAFVQCDACGDVVVCPNCSITLTYHKNPERLVCHYCRHEQALSEKCARCGGTTVRQRGLGTQQAEKLLAERYPYARIARMDVDTTSGKWAHAEILDRVGRGEVDILLGTQMIAKGLDFPNVTLVGVIDADVGINLPDFRASERSFQLLSQVAGRAGRGAKGGEVIIQTRVPTHHAVRAAVTHDYLTFVREELSGRKDPVYPPYTRLANVIVSGEEEEPVARLAIAAAAWLRRLIAEQKVEGVSVVGPAPCPVERVKRRWRWHLLLKAENPAALTRVARYFLEKFEVPSRGDMRVSVDRDPVALL